MNDFLNHSFIYGLLPAFLTTRINLHSCIRQKLSSKANYKTYFISVCFRWESNLWLSRCKRDQLYSLFNYSFTHKQNSRFYSVNLQPFTSSVLTVFLHLDTADGGRKWDGATIKRSSTWCIVQGPDITSLFLKARESSSNVWSTHFKRKHQLLRPCRNLVSPWAFFGHVKTLSWL